MATDRDKTSRKQCADSMNPKSRLSAPEEWQPSVSRLPPNSPQHNLHTSAQVSSVHLHS